MINVQSNFKEIAPIVRRYMMEYGMKAFEQNRRAFAKATSFPFVLLADRAFGELGRVKVSVVAESKKRFSMGIVGLSVIMVEKNNLDSDGKTFNILHFEGDDMGNNYLFVYMWTMLEDYSQHHFGCSAVDVSLDRLVKLLIKETYWGSRGHGMLSTGAIAQPVHDFKIMDEPTYRASQVTKEGVLFGQETKDRRMTMYLTYHSSDEVRSYSPEDLEKVYKIMDRHQQEYDDKPWLFSPMIAAIPKFTPHSIN